MVSGLIGGTGVSVLSRVAEVNRAEHELVPIPRRHSEGSRVQEETLKQEHATMYLLYCKIRTLDWTIEHAITEFTVSTNSRVFFTRCIEHPGKADLNKCYWNPIRKLRIITYFAKLINQQYLKCLNLQGIIWRSLPNWSLSSSENCLVSPNFLFGYPARTLKRMATWKAINY